MFPRLGRAATIWLCATAPFLTFPTVLPDPVRTSIVAAVGVISLFCAVALLREERLLAAAVGVLGGAALTAWAMHPATTSLSHVGGLLTGLLLFAVVARAAHGIPLVVITIMYLLLGTASVMIALVATRFTYQKFLPQAATDLLPQWRLGLPGLPADGFVNPNALGVTVLFIIPIALSLSQRPSLSGGAFRVAAGALSMLALGVLALTQSRASWLAVFLLAVGVTICSLHWSRSRRVVTLFLIMAAPIILLASLHYYDPDQYARLMTPKRMTSVWRRVEILSAAWAMLAESPWTGVGLNGFRRLYLSSEDLGSAEISHAHNTAVQILLDVGIPGFLAYLVFFIVVTRRGLLAWLQAPPSAVRNIAVGGLLTWLCVHLFGLTDALALGSRVGTLQWWIAGLTVTAARSARLSAAGYLDANN